jgi:cytochrome c oxidase cbb3-type subunit 3
MDLRPVVFVCAAVACRASEASRTQAPAAPQAPPAIAYEDHLNAGGVRPAGARLKNPLPQDSANAKDGEHLFGAMNCDGCHGGGALGWVGPSLVDGRWRYGGADGEIFHSIFYGRPRGMPAYGGILSTDAIWRLVTYLRTLPPPKTVPTQVF